MNSTIITAYPQPEGTAFIKLPKGETTMSLLINRIKKAYQEWKAGRKERSEEARLNELRARFGIVAEGTTIFLTFDGVAFKQIHPNTAADGIINYLREAQNSAVALDIFKH